MRWCVGGVRDRESEGEAMECGRERVRVKGRWVRGGESEGDITTK